MEMVPGMVIYVMQIPLMPYLLEKYAALADYALEELFEVYVVEKFFLLFYVTEINEVATLSVQTVEMDVLNIVEKLMAVVLVKKFKEVLTFALLKRWLWAVYVRKHWTFCAALTRGSSCFVILEPVNLWSRGPSTCIQAVVGSQKPWWQAVAPGCLPLKSTEAQKRIC